MNLTGRNFLTLRDYSKKEILHLLDVAARTKAEVKEGTFHNRMANRVIALIFEKPSTRTRCAFSVACAHEGAHPEYLGRYDIQMGKKESIADTARVLSRYFDGIEFRGFSHESVEELAKFASVPVWNGLTDCFHPTQILADFLTLQEHCHQDLASLKMTYVGDGRNNMANSLMIGAAKVGLDFTIGAPKNLWPEQSLIDEAQAFAAESGAVLAFCDDPLTAVKGAHAVYTDVWVSMGEEENPEIKARIAALKPFQVNAQLMAATGNAQSIFMHCLPAIHDMEVSDEVFEGAQSRVFDEAENRLHTIKAVMLTTLGCID